MTTAQVLTFNRYRLDVANGRLWRGKQAIALASQTFAVLCYLVEHAGQVVTKTEFFESLWPGTVVSDGALTFCVRELRKALGDNAKRPQFIETVHRRGYRFIAAVTTRPVVSTQQSVGSSPTFPIQHSVLSSQHSVLVGRETELAQLSTYWEKALAGERQMVFVTGEPGIGKTALVDAFRRRLEARGWSFVPSLPASSPKSLAPAVSFAHGQCIEHYGSGEPYMPILEALGRLCREPDGEYLIALLTQYAPTWLKQMPSLLEATELEALQHRTQGATQERMLRELAEALEVMTAKRPLILWLEDLHWSDPSTVTLLSLLARRGDPARLLVMGTYRPEELQSTGHPLHDVVSDLLAHHRCHELPVSLLTEEAVAEYIRTRFPVSVTPMSFARALLQCTEGHPFFLVNMLDDLVDRQVLQEVGGTWTLTQDLAEVTARTPDGVRQLLARQQVRLAPPEQRILEAASLAGQEFAAATVAAALATDAVEIGEQCAQLAQRRQFLIPAGVVEWPDGIVTTRYRFQHALQQQMWHERIPLERRQQWHRRMGERLEAAYSAHVGDIAAELAVHFEQGQEYRKAIHYLHQSGENALQRSAHVEALDLLTQGLELLKTLPDTPERAQQELTLHLAVGAPLMFTKGLAVPEVGVAYTRALALCRQMGESPQIFSALAGLRIFSTVRGELQTARELGEQLLRLAKRTQDPVRLVEAHYHLAAPLTFLGELASAREHFEQMLALCVPQQPRASVHRHGADLGVIALAELAPILWTLGYPQQARERGCAALTRAREMDLPFSKIVAWFVNIEVCQFLHEAQAVQQQAEELSEFCQEQGFSGYFAEGTVVVQGWALTMQGQEEEGLRLMRQGLAASRARGVALRRSYGLALLAEACGKTGQIEEGLTALAEALAVVDRTGERFWEAELYRLKGELLLEQAGKLRD